jgi:predicted RND superfamily exporter protein
MIDYIIRYRWVIIVSCLLLGIGFTAIIPLSKTDPEIRNYVPQRMSSRVATDKIENEFGVQDMIVVLFSDSSILQSNNLTRIREIDKDISRLNGVSNRMSPFTMKSIKGEEGMMIADPLIKKIPTNDDEYLTLKESILENRFAHDIVI